MKTFNDLRAEVLGWLDEATNTTQTKTNAGRAINQAHADRCASASWPFMLWGNPETVTLVANQRRYALHQDFARPIYFWNRSTNSYLVETPLRNLEGSLADWNNDTSGDRFIFCESSPVSAQPSATSVVTVTSSSASDTSSTKAITVYGVTSDGTTSESITPTGTTGANGLLSFTKILGVTKGAAWAGTLTLTAGAVTLLKLFASEYARSYPQIELLWKPTGGEVVEYRFYRKPRVLSADNDVPEIPFPWSQILVWDALLLMAAYDNNADAGKVAIWRDRQRTLEEGMQHAFLEARTVGAEPRYVRNLSDSETGPRISINY